MQLLDWHIHLDKSLPGPLGSIGAWLHRAEMALREDFPLHHAPEETANVLHRKLQQHQVRISLCCRGSTRGEACRFLSSRDSELHQNRHVGLQDVLKNLEVHRRTFQQIHKDRSVHGVPVPPEQLQDMAERYGLRWFSITSQQKSYCGV